MHILVTGGTGFIGCALVPALVGRGHDVTVLSRSMRGAENGVVYCQTLSEARLEIDAVINLAGASLAERRWTARYKREIVASRVDFTQKLVGGLTQLQNPPRVLISGSAVGFYGHDSSAVFTEANGRGRGFSADLCAAWEQAAEGALGVIPQVSLLRLGVVFDRGGGALQEMLRSFQFGLQSWLGTGEQWLSWIHRADVVSAICHLLDHPTASGAFNLTAPEPVTHRAFSEAAARHLRTRLSAGVPKAVMRLLVGEMADELLLNGQKVLPDRLMKGGFTFDHSDIDSALQSILSDDG